MLQEIKFCRVDFDCENLLLANYKFFPALTFNRFANINTVQGQQAQLLDSHFGLTRVKCNH